MVKALTYIRPTGRAFMQHCQEASLTRGASMHAGGVSVRLGLTGWPRIAEELIIERDVRLNRSVGCRYHVQHLSSGGSVEIVRRARRDGQPITAEASPHHLLLTHDEVTALLERLDAELQPFIDNLEIAKALAQSMLDPLQRAEDAIKKRLDAAVQQFTRGGLNAEAVRAVSPYRSE